MTNDNPIGWFEIPVTDMDRAIAFYEKVFGHTFQKHKMGEIEMAFFPYVKDGTGATGTLAKHEWYKPSQDGVVIYFTAKSGDCANELAKVKEAGGTVIVDKKSIGEHGFIGIFIDSEGNKVAVHSMK